MTFRWLDINNSGTLSKEELLLFLPAGKNTLENATSIITKVNSAVGHEVPDGVTESAVLAFAESEPAQWKELGLATVFHVSFDK